MGRKRGQGIIQLLVGDYSRPFLSSEWGRKSKRRGREGMRLPGHSRGSDFMDDICRGDFPLAQCPVLSDGMSLTLTECHTISPVSDFGAFFC